MYLIKIYNYRFLIFGIFIIIIIYYYNKNNELISKCPILPLKIYYNESFFNDDDYNIILKNCKKLDSKLIKENSFIVNNRSYIKISNNNIINKLFYNKNTLNKIKNILGLKVNIGKLDNIPIEYRVYNKNGSMGWHKDTIIDFTCPQLEIVYTLENNSDSYTKWMDKNNNEYEISTKPNSILIVQADGVYHKVTPLNRGIRSIIKVAYKILCD